MSPRRLSAKRKSNRVAWTNFASCAEILYSIAPPDTHRDRQTQVAQQQGYANSSKAATLGKFPTLKCAQKKPAPDDIFSSRLGAALVQLRVALKAPAAPIVWRRRANVAPIARHILAGAAAVARLQQRHCASSRRDDEHLRLLHFFGSRVARYLAAEVAAAATRSAN